MKERDQSQQPEARVFISYSRKDLARAEWLRERLIEAGFDAYLDKHDIAPGEPWRERIGSLIECAEKVVFLVSPDSTESEICDWEVSHSENLSKTILPVVVRLTDLALVPDRLKRLNFIFMRDDDETREGMSKLIAALGVDLPWEREKTRIGDLALNWDRKGKPSHFLLSGDSAIRPAEEWRDAYPSTSPPPTGLQLEFIEKSRERQIRRRRYAISGGSVLAALFAIGAVLLVQVQERAASERDQKLATQSRELAAAAEQSNDAGDYSTAMLLALAGLPDETRPPQDGGPPRPLVPEARRALRTALMFNRELRVIKVSERAVHDASFNPADPTRVITASGSLAQIWSAETGEPLTVLEGHARPVLSAKYSGDGKRVVTASEDGTALIWDSNGGAALHRLEGAASDYFLARFSPDGEKIVTLSARGDHPIRIWPTAGVNPIRELIVEDAFVGSAEFGPGSETLFVATTNGAMRLDGILDESIERKRLTDVATSHFSLSQDGARFVAVASDEPVAWLGEITSPAGALRLEGHFFSASFSPDSTRFVIASKDGMAQIRDSSTGREITRLLVPETTVTAADFSGDGDWVVTAAGDGTARIWKAQSSRPEAVWLVGLEGRRADLGYTQSGEWRVAGPAVDMLAFWSGRGGSATWTASGAGAGIRAVAFDQGSELVATLYADGSAEVRFVETGALVSPNLRIEGEALAIALSPDGERLAAGSSHEVRVWDTATGEQLGRLPDLAFGAIELAFEARGDRLGVLTGDGSSFLWRPGVGEKTELCRTETSVRAIAFSPDGARVACIVAKEVLIQMTDTGAADEPVILQGHDGQIVDLAFSFDGRMLATVSRGENYALRIWDSETGGELARFEQVVDDLTKDGLARTAFAPTGDAISTLSLSGALKVWRVYPTTQSLVDAAKHAAPRCLTAKQLAAASLDEASQDWCRQKFVAADAENPPPM